MKKMNSLKLRQYLQLAAAAGLIPMTCIVLYVMNSTGNKDINFTVQEMRGNTFQRPLEQLLDLLPRYEAAARKAQAGDSSAKTEMSGVQQQIDAHFDALTSIYNGDLGRALKFTDEELAARKRDNARLSVVVGEWQSLKGGSIEAAAADTANGTLVSAVRTMIAHEGDLSNLILDFDLDSYYLVDSTLGALPQTQQRLSDSILQVDGWIRSGTVAANSAQIAVIAAMLQQDDEDRITGDAQTSLSEDKNFHGISQSLQNNLPPAIAKYTAANQAYLKLLNNLVAGQTVSAADLDAAGWNAHAESLALWETSADELDTLLSIRLKDLRYSRWMSFSGVAAALVLVTSVMLLLTGRLSRILKAICRDLNIGSDHLTNSAEQVSSAGQTLAEGASEQAASLEETSASLEELSSMTRQNTESAQKAHDLAKEARQSAERGVVDMQTMSVAMDAIKGSSDEIAKIIKTIDEIAFQTNILALNAAVEAARAGEAGMGFAVVADEVRNLAQRSAQAAKETAAKIEGALQKTVQGVQISAKVAEAFNEIATKVRQVDELAAEVAGACREQSQGITQINTAVGLMDKVTQSNAACAEESAAAARELNSQARTMKDVVNQLLNLVGGQNRQTTTHSAPAPVSKKESRPAQPAPKRAVIFKGNSSGSGNGNGHAKGNGNGNGSGNGHAKEPTELGLAGKSRRGEIPMDGDFRDF